MVRYSSVSIDILRIKVFSWQRNDLVVNYVMIIQFKQGYGAETINVLRDLCPSSMGPSSVLEMPQKLASYLLSPVAGKKLVIEFPLTLGRDFAGVVTQVGHGVKNDVRVGDEVYGVVGVQRQGSHAEYVVVSADTVRLLA